MIDRPVGMPLLLQNAPQRVNQFLLLVIEPWLFLERLLEFPRREVVHAAEIVQRQFDTYMEIPVVEDPADIIAAG